VEITVNPYADRKAFRYARCFLCGRNLEDHDWFVNAKLPVGHAIASVVYVDPTVSPQADRGVTDVPTYGLRRSGRRKSEGAVKQGVKG